MAQIDEIQQRLAPELEAMNSIIAATLATPNEMMNNVVSTYLQVKGKQIRPLMVLLSAKLFGPVNEHVLHAAAAIEMLHNASLIHDDVVDETALRRGVPTINQQWGNQIAVLVGDFFVSNALAAGIRTGKVDIISQISDLGKELSLGEVDQICNARSHSLSEDAYFDMIGKKTASLFTSCVRLGALAAGADEHQISHLAEYARRLGLCFQIKDDIFDYYPDNETGKPSGNDLREGKVTLPLLHALTSAHESKAAPMRALLLDGALDDDKIADLINFARENGGIEYSYDVMRRLQANADQLLREAYPDSEARQAFRDIFEFIISRKK